MTQGKSLTDLIYKFIEDLRKINANKYMLIAFITILSISDLCKNPTALSLYLFDGLKTRGKSLQISFQRITIINHPHPRGAQALPRLIILARYPI